MKEPKPLSPKHPDPTTPHQTPLARNPILKVPHRATPLLAAQLLPAQASLTHFFLRSKAEYCQDPRCKNVLLPETQLLVLQRPLPSVGVSHLDQELLHAGDPVIFRCGSLLATGMLGLVRSSVGGWLPLQDCCQSLLRDRPVVVVIIIIIIIIIGPSGASLQARIRLQDPATVAVHDRGELPSRSDSECGDSSTSVDIADLRRRKFAVFAWVRGCGLVDESFCVPRRRRGREARWINGHVPSNGDRTGAVDAGETRWITVVLASTGGAAVGAVAVWVLAGVLVWDSTASKHGCACQGCWVCCWQCWPGVGSIV